MNAACLVYVKTLKNVRLNSVPKLVVKGNVLLRGRVNCAVGFHQNVKMTRSMVMNGDEVLVRAGPLDGTSPALTAASSVPGDWGIAAMLKMKVGVLSVTVEQHTEGRLQESQSMLDPEMVVCSVVSAHPRVEALESSSIKVALRSSPDRMRAAVNV